MVVRGVSSSVQLMFQLPGQVKSSKTGLSTVFGLTIDDLFFNQVKVTLTAVLWTHKAEEG